MVADPVEVVLAERGTGDDPKPVFGNAGDGEVAFDATAVVEHLRVCERAHAPSNPVVTEMLEEFGRAATADLDFGKRREVEDRSRLATRSVLGLDGRRPQAARPTAGAQ